MSEHFIHTFSKMLRDIQGYWRIISNIHRDETRRERRRHPMPFLENRKKCPDFGKRPWLCPSFHSKCNFNVILGEKLPNLSLRNFSFLVFLMKCLSKCPNSRRLPLPWKISGCAPALRHYSFGKTLHLKCLTVFWIRLSR